MLDKFLVDVFFSPLAFYLAILVLVLAIALLLADDAQRKPVTVLYLLGFLSACFKIWLMRQAPQWLDINPDSVTYQLHAQAFALHWQGQTVDAAAYQLAGLLHPSELWRGIWEPSTVLPYASVFGTFEWVYAAYVGCWRLLTDDWLTWAVYSNAAFAAFFPAASYVIARSLNASGRVAMIAAVIGLVDPSSAVNASWILKDTLACFLALTALWAAIRLMTMPNWSTVSVLIVSAALMATVRFVGFVALVAAVICIMPTLLSPKYRRSLAYLIASVVGAFTFFGGLYVTPKRVDFASLYHALVMPLEAKKQTLVAVPTEAAADESVIAYRERFAANPVLALVTSAARTLFAPYPWVAITHGLDWKTGIELYYPGVLLWTMCLPGIAWGGRIFMQSPNRPFLLLVLMTGALLGAYTIFLGEWSTRQRVFMLPVFFVFAAIGWNDIAKRLYNRFMFRESATIDIR